MVTKTSSHTFAHQVTLVDTQPLAELGGISTYTCPIPSSPVPETAIHFSGVTPSGLGMLPEVHKQKYEPKRLFSIPLTLVEYGGHQWIEEFVVGISTTLAQLARADDRDVPDAVNALEQLFN